VFAGAILVNNLLMSSDFLKKVSKIMNLLPVSLRESSDGRGFRAITAL
jgi:hypothetical protein